VADDSDPDDEVNLELLVPDGTAVLPVLRWAQRLSRGPGDSVAAYAKDLGIDVGERPERRSGTGVGLLRHRIERRARFQRPS
jgi:hypothetical protein